MLLRNMVNPDCRAEHESKLMIIADECVVTGGWVSVGPLVLIQEDKKIDNFYSKVCDSSSSTTRLLASPLDGRT